MCNKFRRHIQNWVCASPKCSYLKLCRICSLLSPDQPAWQICCGSPSRFPCSVPKEETPWAMRRNAVRTQCGCTLVLETDGSFSIYIPWCSWSYKCPTQSMRKGNSYTFLYITHIVNLRLVSANAYFLQMHTYWRENFCNFFIMSMLLSSTKRNSSIYTNGVYTPMEFKYASKSSILDTTLLVCQLNLLPQFSWLLSDNTVFQTQSSFLK